MLPILYLSAFINRNRSRYYELLGGVTERGAWMEWLLEEAGILEHVKYGKYQLYVNRELIELING